MQRTNFFMGTHSYDNTEHLKVGVVVAETHPGHILTVLRDDARYYLKCPHARQRAICIHHFQCLCSFIFFYCLLEMCATEYITGVHQC